jgi:hypothetical protein
MDLIDLDSFARNMGSGELSEFLHELHWGTHARQVTAHFRQRQHARALDGVRAVDGLGAPTTTIDATVFHYWGQRLGYQCWDDDQFLREMRRDNPETRVRAEASKAMIVVPDWGGSEVGDA